MLVSKDIQVMVDEGQAVKWPDGKIYPTMDVNGQKQPVHPESQAPFSFVPDRIRATQKGFGSAMQGK